MMLQEHLVQHYILWRAVWKENSISTPCREFFNVSSNTGSGFSLNDIHVKGRNNMNKLVEIFIRWTTHAAALLTDVQKMYNIVKLQEEDWCLQRYLWGENLYPSKFRQQKIIKTLSMASNLVAIKRNMHSEKQHQHQNYPEYPKANIVIQKDVSVNDYLSEANTKEEVMQLADGSK